MNRICRTAAVLLSLASFACAAEGDPNSLVEVGELDDRLFDYKFAPQVTSIEEVTSIAEIGTVNVGVAPTRDHLIVAGPMKILDVPDEGLMTIYLEALPEPPPIEPPSADGADETATEIPEPEELESDDMRFMMFAENEDGQWAPILVVGEYAVDGIPTASQLMSFDSVLYAPTEKIMVGYHGSIGQEFVAAMDVTATGRIGIFALPEQTAGGIHGNHDYMMMAMCGEARPCRAPADPGPIGETTVHGSDIGSAGALNR